MTFRYRQLDYNLANPQAVGGDMTFGRGGFNFLVDNPTAVAQAVLTRLNLWMGEWFLNRQSGTPWLQQILGHSPARGLPDAAIRARILGTPFVTRMESYSSEYNSTYRTFVVSCQLYTAFGQVTTAPAGAMMTPTRAILMPLALTPPQQALPLPAPLRALPPR
jgi:hypothetical protein